MGRGSSKAGGGGGGNANGPMNQILDKLNGNEPWTKADKSALNSAIKNAAVGDSLIYTGSGGSETYIKGPNGWEHVGVVDSPKDTSTMSMTMVTMAGYQDSGGNSWSYKPAQSTKQPTAKATTAKSNAVTGQSVKQAQRQLTQAKGQATRAQQAYQKALDAISNFDWNQKNALSKMEKLIKRRDTASKKKDAAVLKRNKLQKQYTKVSQSFAKKQAKAKTKAIKNGAPLF